MAIFLVLPSVAYANAGTSLMWAGMIHLVLGNLLIGMVEGLILAKFFKAPVRKTIGLLVAANYFSAWVGGLFLRGLIVYNAPVDLNNGWLFFWIMVFVTYIITLLLEFPFVAIALFRQKQWLKKTIIGSLVIQSISYVVLFGWYWVVSGTSLYTQMHIVEPSSIVMPADISVYFVGADDGDIYKMRLNGLKTHKIFSTAANTKKNIFKLMVRLSPGDNKRGELVFCIDPEDDNLNPIRTWSTGYAVLPKYGSGKAPKLGAAWESKWEFWTGFWAVQGISGKNKKMNKRAGFSFETPFGSWNVRNAMHLPGDKVLLQLGKNQICIYDPENKRIALIARGRTPIAVIEKEN